MKKVLATLIASASLFGAHVANAQTWTPTSSSAPVLKWEGLVTVQKGSGPILDCTLYVEVDNPGSGATTTGRAKLDTPAHPACPYIVLVGMPYEVDYDAGLPETLTFRAVYAETPLTPGDCSGDITAVLNDGTDDSLDINALLPEVLPGTGDCTIVGNLTLVDPSAVDIS
ncbi:MAG TPA: hypothetical protein VFG34_08735 [Sphingopyxis sp.]|nr:hypothetical protein [Sphingopyxis sp.]